MKLRKLLPIATIASVVTIATPLVASCSAKTYTYDLTKEFTPTIQKKDADILASQATTIYLEDAKKDKRIIADDLAYSYISIGFSQLGYETLSVTPREINVDKKLISLSFAIEGKGIMPEYPDKRCKEEVTIKNIPIGVGYVVITGGGIKWGLSHQVDNEGKYLLDNKDWSYYQKDTIEGVDPIVHDWNSKKLNSVSGVEQTAAISIIILGLAFGLPSISYYLDGCQPIE